LLKLKKILWRLSVMRSSISLTSGKQACLVGIAIFVLAGLCLSQSAVSPSPSDWTEFHRDNMQRWNPYETVLNVNNVGRLQRKWSFIKGREVFSSPAVANGVAYVGSLDGNLYALNAITGALLWSYVTGAEVAESSPAVANGVVYVGSYDNNVYALNATTGAKLWSFATGFWVTSSPAVANGVVYIGSLDHTVYALNASTGAKLWSFATGAAIESSPAVANGVVYVGSFDHNVYALNASTGAKLWSFATDSDNPVPSSPAVANGVVYVGSTDYNVYALNANTGKELWSFATGGVVWSSPAVANGVVYIGSMDGNVYALNAGTGAKLWSYATGGRADSSPAVANGMVYFGSDDGNVYALNSSTGALLWSYQTGAYVFSSPAVANGVVYVGSSDHNLYAFGLPGAGSYLTMKSSVNPALINQSLTFTTTSLAANQSFGNVTGTVTFRAGATTLGKVPISGGHATITTSAGHLGIGSHVVTATYSGSSVFAAISASLTQVITEAELSPTSLNFGDQAVGTTSAPKTVTITNLGSAAFGIEMLFATGNFSIKAKTCGTSLAAGAHCAVTIVFRPAGTSNRYGNFWIYDHAGGSPQKVSLTGFGT
jgi:outer membrane protein assembly factor BamB